MKLGTELVQELLGVAYVLGIAVKVDEQLVRLVNLLSELLVLEVLLSHLAVPPGAVGDEEAGDVAHSNCCLRSLGSLVLFLLGLGYVLGNVDQLVEKCQVGVGFLRSWKE